VAVIDKARTNSPQVAEGIDIRSLPIGAEEAFVLSYSDGTSSVFDIASATGLDSGRVGRIMARLVELGAVVIEARGSMPPGSVAFNAARCDTRRMSPADRLATKRIEGLLRLKLG
jgi:hypothetical protein